MIEELIGAFQSKRSIYVSTNDAASILESVSYYLDSENIKESRFKRIPFLLASGDDVGEHLFVPMTVLDVSISLAIDNRPSVTPIFSSNLSKVSSLVDKNLLICKINRKNLKCKNFETVCLINQGIPNFRARCESIIASNDLNYNEIKRFVDSKSFNIEVVLAKDEDKSMYHKFTFASSDGNKIVFEKNLAKALLKLSSIEKESIKDSMINPEFLNNIVLSVDSNKDELKEMIRYKSGGNKIINVGSKVVAKPTNLMKSKIIGTVVGKSANIINVKWDKKSIKYDLDNPKTYFLLEFVD